MAEATTTDEQSIWRLHGIVPDIIPTEPSQPLNVSFIEHAVDVGNDLKTSQILSPPLIRYIPDVGKTYTLIVCDIDHESNFPLWIISNISGNTIENGNTLVSYRIPEYDQQLHRIFLLVCEETEAIEYSGSEMTDDEKNAFRLADYLASNPLTPVACNFFKHRWESRDKVEAAKQALEVKDDEETIVPDRFLTEEELAATIAKCAELKLGEVVIADETTKVVVAASDPSIVGNLMREELQTLFASDFGSLSSVMIGREKYRTQKVEENKVYCACTSPMGGNILMARRFRNIVFYCNTDCGMRRQWIVSYTALDEHIWSEFGRTGV